MGITEIFLNYYQYFLRGTQTTVIVSLITVLLGTVLGCLIALLRLSKFRLCAGFAKLYITVAYALYQNAVKLGLGTKVKLWDKPLWE